MAGWLMGIVASIVATTLIDVIMAEGETKRFVKGIASLLVLVAIITPLPKLLNLDVDFSKETPSIGSESTENNDYLARIYEKRYLESKLGIQNALKLSGLSGVVITINYTYTAGTSPTINNVTADLSNLVITDKNPNIDINKTVRGTICDMIKCKEENITIMGG